ncbi:hypothetical protein [Halorarius litoreus]|uniref:hypothetical protein n=1 Tax=Halorarius litoreus TaxID=2962676 RepID=UPI0020CBF46A|nr:hypothetical protein [Halorarius litoreus]
MYELSVGEALFEYEQEISLQTLRRAIDAHVNEDARQTARFKSVICPEDAADVLQTTASFLNETSVEITDHGDHYGVEISRTIRRSDISGGQRTIEGSFALIDNSSPDVWTAVTGAGPDFYERGVLWLFKQAEPNISEFFVNSSDLELILDNVKASLPTEPEIRVNKAVAYTRKDEGTISFETNPYKEVFRVSETNDKYVDKIDFDVVGDNDALFSGFISRDGQLKFESGTVGLFFEHLLVEYARVGQDKADIFGNRERSQETGDVDQIQIRFNSDVFRNPDDHDDLIEALGGLTRSSLTVYHQNPYAHLSVLDYVDGSSCDVLVTEPDTVSLVPSYRGSMNSLMRISEQISKEFDEGMVTELGQPDYGPSDFFN